MLESFYGKLKKHFKGSLIRVGEATEIDPHAKEYLNRLAGSGRVERVKWGWYWVPDTYSDFFDFLAKDRHFKVLHKQSAAAYWNGDFIHRDQYTVAVDDQAYGKALESFARSRGWNVAAERRKFQAKEYKKVGRLYVEALEPTIIDCTKEWSFADAFACVRENQSKIDWKVISKRFWERMKGRNVRVGQVLNYGVDVMNREDGKSAESRTRIQDNFVRRQVEEAALKVVDLAEAH